MVVITLPDGSKASMKRSDAYYMAKGIIGSLVESVPRNTESHISLANLEESFDQIYVDGDDLDRH